MNDVGAMPNPHVEEPERFPGGPDALADQSRYGEIPDGPVGVDLPPEVTPSSVDVPDTVTEPDDKPQEPAADHDEDEDSEPETPV
jgi:hypothetical protein